MIVPVLSGLLILGTVVGSGLMTLAVSVSDDSQRWPWPQGLAVAAVLGLAVHGLVGIALGALGLFSFPAVAGTVTILGVLARMLRPTSRWPLGPASRVEVIGFLLVGSLAVSLFAGRPFEMLLGGRDATTYLVSGVALSRQGSLVLRDESSGRLTPADLRFFYPHAGQRGKGLPPVEAMKYPGFGFADVESGRIAAQGLDLQPALIGLFHGAFGLWGALSAVSAVGVAAALAVWSAGTLLLGAWAGLLGAGLLVADLVEVWAARYPTAEILLQALLFGGAAAFLRGNRGSDAIAGFLLGAAFFAKVEAVLLFLPVGALAVFQLRQRGDVPTAPFWMAGAVTVVLAAGYWLAFQPHYVQMAGHFFLRLQKNLMVRTFASADWGAIGAALFVALLGAFAVARLRRRGFRIPSSTVGRLTAVVLVAAFAYGYWLRPDLAAHDGAKTLVWLSWYTTPFLLFLGVAGLVLWLWQERNTRRLFVAGVLLTFAVIFLQFLFVNIEHLYLTRRFVPTILPAVCLFAAFAITTIGRAGITPWLPGAVVAVVVFAGAAGGVVLRSSHVYDHREYPGLAGQLAEAARDLRDADLVFVSDLETRNLLGPTLEFVYGLPTVILWPQNYDEAQPRIRKWIEQGWRLAALSTDGRLNRRPSTDELAFVEKYWLRIAQLEPLKDGFPDGIYEYDMPLSRFAAGPGSHPLFGYWRENGGELAQTVCGHPYRLLGGNEYLLRRVRNRCESPAGPAAYLVHADEAKSWKRWLGAHGAKFRERTVEGSVLLTELEAREWDGTRRLSGKRWSVGASHHPTDASLAVDGDPGTRWGTQERRRPEMSYTVVFDQPTDVSWVRIRMGEFWRDRAERLAWEVVRADGSEERVEIADVGDAAQWQDGLPVENPHGNRDLWIGERNVRELRIVNLGEHSHFDWSIAELVIEGRVAPAEGR